MKASDKTKKEQITALAIVILISILTNIFINL
jgi:hypothetical protein